MKKTLAILLAIAMLATLLVGCSSGNKTTSSASASAADSASASASASSAAASSSSAAAASASGSADKVPVTIQFMHQQVEQERQDAVGKMISAFEAKYPYITVEPIAVDEDSFDTKVAALASAGTMPAICEFSQDQAKTYVTQQLIDTDACSEVIADQGEDSWFSGALNVIKTEDGSSYVGVPICGWVQGIWCNTAMLKEKGFSLPQSWDDVLKIAKAFNDPTNQTYGIALPTSDSAFTEQVFSQFALSNGANVFDADGKVTIDTDAMKEAINYYKELSQYSMPGSTEVADVKDAFVGQHTPMAMYSTYILSACQDAGFLDSVELALPTKQTSAAYGCVTCFSIGAGLSDDQREAAKLFVQYMVSDEGNMAWLLMAPGGVQPVLTSVANNTAYTQNESIVPLAHLLTEVGTAFDNLQLFGVVDGKNFMAMGDITNSGILSKMINNVVVQNADVDSEAASAQSQAESLIS